MVPVADVGMLSAANLDDLGETGLGVHRRLAGHLREAEQSSRMSKTDLAARPMFIRKRDAIEAHLAIVFAALAVAREIQDRTGSSTGRRAIALAADILKCVKPDLPASLRRPCLTATL
jgi:hypothetical protein